MGVEMIKDRFGEDQLVLSNEDFYNDDIMGDKFANYDIMKIIKSSSNKYTLVAKVVSKKNSKIYLLKQLSNNLNQDQINKEFQILNKLNHPNITRYFKLFVDNGNVYIVKEYVDNGGLDKLIDAYKSIEKPIDTNTLWNIFMQCMAGLEYLHKNNIIHKKISCKNILMNENKVVKLDDIQVDMSQKTQNEDIYDMGNVFQKLISIVDENSYPIEMRSIINLMVNNYQSQNTTQLFNEIMKQYIKNVAKVSSINSIFRCMSSFQEFAYKMYQFKNSFNEQNTPVAYYYVNCLNSYISNGDPKDIVIFYNHFRNLLYKNSQMNNDVEIRPRQVLEFLLERLNKETGTNFRGASFGTQMMIFNEDKKQALQLFQQYFNNNFNSIISNQFIGYIKTKRICNKCGKGYYSFNIHPFIEFDVDMCRMVKNDANGNVLSMNFIENWFRAQNNQKKVLSPEHKIVCQKCKIITEFREFKQFYILPRCFIISLNRGKNYTNTFEIQIPPVLNLKDKIETDDSPRLFNLVGIVKRMVDAKQDEYFIAIYKDVQQNIWKLCDRNTVTIIQNPLAHKEGLVVVLFYSAINMIGQ